MGDCGDPLACTTASNLGDWLLLMESTSLLMLFPRVQALSTAGRRQGRQPVGGRSQLEKKTLEKGREMQGMRVVVATRKHEDEAAPLRCGDA